MKQLRRGMRWVVLALTGSMLFSITGNTGAYGGCGRFAANGLLAPVDFCYILDCKSGILGGAIQLCGNNPVLADCPTTGTATTQAAK